MLKKMPGYRANFLCFPSKNGCALTLFRYCGVKLTVSTLSFKYQDRLDRIPGCPPKQRESKKCKAIRMVYTDPPTEKCFIPRPLEKDARSNHHTDDNCDGWGLSFFTTIEAAKAKMKSILLTYGEDCTLLKGRKLAEGVIEKNDGVLSTPSKTGHFTLHESKGARLWNQFNVVDHRVV